jgi:hypothetical protein
MDVRGAAVIPAGIDGFETDPSGLASRLRAAQERLAGRIDIVVVALARKAE